MGYSFYYPPENKVLVARNAKFLENSLITQEASGRLEDLEIIQDEDTYPSIDTSLNHEEDDLEIDKPQSDIIPIRRSTRTRHLTDCMCLYIDAEEHELEDLGEPANYKAVLLDPGSDKWLNAMNVEMQSMKNNEVWVLVELPPNGKTNAKQSIFATSFAKAEYIATFDASKEAVWVRKFISGLGITKRARHFHAKVHYLRKVIEYGDVKLEKVHTDDNLADPFTKALEFPKHSEHTRNIGMLPANNKVWDLVDLPPNGKTVGSKWFFKKKTDIDGAVHTYKACLVAKGYTQTLKIDCEETLSPVAEIRAIKILIAIAALYDYEIWQMDVKIAFLNGYLSEEVYME
uniref:Putative retrotransposon Ty1-copia subclass protein n=1 Tax=Tanacetum cinerariifolium TaxID=118510 RepID=A0A699IFJ9_TANCI|nr:putative retrotransposon Ty1-copia subclass protein [Tanacetum cinerariifolium]